MKSLLLLLLPLVSWGQSNFNFSCSSDVQGGSSVPCTLSVKGTSVVGVQFDFISTNVTTMIPTLPSSLAVIGKSIQCNLKTCIVFGGIKSIPSGTVVTLNFQTTKGGKTTTVGINSLIVSDAAANLIPSTINGSSIHVH